MKALRKFLVVSFLDDPDTGERVEGRVEIWASGEKNAEKMAAEFFPELDGARISIKPENKIRRLHCGGSYDV
jgi:hypothetical protein